MTNIITISKTVFENGLTKRYKNKFKAIFSWWVKLSETNAVKKFTIIKRKRFGF